MIFTTIVNVFIVIISYNFFFAVAAVFIVIMAVSNALLHSKRKITRKRKKGKEERDRLEEEKMTGLCKRPATPGVL